jgi:hypothetical protein
VAGPDHTREALLKLKAQGPLAEISRPKHLDDPVDFCLCDLDGRNPDDSPVGRC